jgi:NAD(P)-dependent dehydrogenase (short-subunit alcohol dehydrogenase family)
VDVTSDESVKNWAAELLKNNDAPDLLINNAALINRSAPLWELSADEFDSVINVNIIGVANVIRHFAPAMIRRRSGVIANFSSDGANPPRPKSLRIALPNTPSKVSPRRLRRNYPPAWQPSR